MKKIMFLSVIAGLVFVGFDASVGATYKCNLQGMYGNEDHYLFIGDPYVDGHGFSSGKGFACKHTSNQDGCDQNVKIVVFGSHKLHMEKRTDIAGYNCNHVGNNRWDKLNVNELNWCSNTSGWVEMGKLDGYRVFCRELKEYEGIKYCLFDSNMCKKSGDDEKPDDDKPGNVVKDCAEGEERATRDLSLTIPACDGSMCSPIVKGLCYPSLMLRCLEAAERGEPANWNGNDCNCGNKQEWDKDNKKCVVPTKKPTKTCKELYPNASPERLACCYAGSATTWTGADTDIDPKLCVCKDPKTEWEYDSGSNRGVCKPKTESVQPVIQPEEEDCWYTFYGEFNCGNGVRVKKNSHIKLSNDDLKGMTCTKFQEIYGNDVRGIEGLFRKICLNSQYTEQISLDAATKNAISKINSLSGDVTVWRNEEGKFNTARLASDATAGVVLGTIGGVVSAKVIKKKQLEKGFDVLHCTVGGQKMADYGDTFRVSYQR